MNKEQTLSILGLDQLPPKAKTSNERCAVLVERANETKDYAIAANGGIVVDKQSKSAIVRIIEYYPVVAEVVVPIPESDWRKETIDFLVSNKMNRKKMEEKTDDELGKLMKVYKK